MTACGTAGSGEVVTEQRPAGPFTAIEVSDALVLHVTVDGGADPAIEVTFDDNLIDAIATRIEGDTLIVEAAENYSVAGSGRRVVVTVPQLDRIAASGAADIVASGESARLEVEAGGASDVDLAELRTEEVQLDVSGASDVIVQASAVARGRASGASSVSVLGDPPIIDIETSGASSVERG